MRDLNLPDWEHHTVDANRSRILLKVLDDSYLVQVLSE